MDELNKGLALSVTGRERDEALREFKRHVRRWRVALPAIEPLVLDFGLGRFSRIGLIEYWIANESAAGYCGKYLFVFKNQTCPRHRHRIKHETFFLIEGRLRVEIGRRRIDLRRGDVLPIRTGVYHSFTGLEPSLLLELSMPCAIDDNYFADSRIPIGGNHRPRPERMKPQSRPQ